MNGQTAIATDLYHELRGAGPAVLFMPGATGDAGHFTGVAERLADEFTVVTYDRRGNSRSPRLADGEQSSIAAQADDAAALIEALGLAPAVVFGTSAAGDILLELVARRPEVVRAALVHEPALVAVQPQTDGGDETLEAIVATAARDPRAGIEFLVRHNTSDEMFESLDADLRERMLANGAHFFANELEPVASYVPEVERIRATGTPIRLLASRDGLDEYKVACAWLGERLDLPVDYVSGHHAPYLEQPEVLAEELRPLLRELSSPPRP